MNATLEQSSNSTAMSTPKPEVKKLAKIGQNLYVSEQGREFRIGDSYDTFLSRNGITAGDENGRDFLHVRQFAWAEAAKNGLEHKSIVKVSVGAVWSKRKGWQETMSIALRGGRPTFEAAQAAIEKSRSQSEKRLLAMSGDATELQDKE